ncbi:MAG: hypothetical protein CME64_08720 [Halobacteriovoraceae bacterium]|nr:hypothetical protein [Halobacteriovoraceae bacterium]|tara:strand:+ start:283766 stop:284284 length:519 start_codon:yes stop_codon:yes gene_type:complete
MSEDYKDFLNDSHKTPKRLDESVLHMVHSDLDPSHKVVFIKLALIQGFIGVLTMLFCPQFNLSLTNNYDLFHYFHTNFGHAICMIICGSIFLGSGAIFAASILSKAELKKIHSCAPLYYMGLSIIAVSAFMILGAEVYLNLLTFWLLGAICSGLLLFELGRLARKKANQAFN